MASSSTTNNQNHLPVAGVWKRLIEEDPLGDMESADRSTLVLWTQSRTSGIYVDIRLPEGSPGRSVEAAQALGIEARPGALAAQGINSAANKKLLVNHRDILARQKSFAGLIDYQPHDTTDGKALQEDQVLKNLVETLKNGQFHERAIHLCTCLWNRHMDYQPPTGGLDVGVCASKASCYDDGSLLMRETGDDASYAEDWLCQPQTFEGPFAALTLESENGASGARCGYWVRAGNKFAYAIGRPQSQDYAAKAVNTSAKVKDCIGKSLLEAAQELEEDVEEQLDLMACYVCATGEISDNGKQWRILQCTNPELVGCMLIGSTGSDNICSQLSGTNGGKVGSVIEQVIHTAGNNGTVKRVWKVNELSDCSLPL